MLPPEVTEIAYKRSAANLVSKPGEYEKELKTKKTKHRVIGELSSFFIFASVLTFTRKKKKRFHELDFIF